MTHKEVKKDNEIVVERSLSNNNIQFRYHLPQSTLDLTLDFCCFSKSGMLKLRRENVSLKIFICIQF